MPIQSRHSLAALMTVSLAVATPLFFAQIGPVRAQAGGGSAAGSGATGPSGAGAMGSTAVGGASDRGGSGTGRMMSDSPRSGMSRDASGSAMSGSSGNDATRGGGGGAVRGEDGSLVGTAKLNAALAALEGSATGTRSRSSGISARVVLVEEYETAMRNALAIQDLAQRRAAVDEARERLQRATDRQVSSDVIARVDSILGLPTVSR